MQKFGPAFEHEENHIKIIETATAMFQKFVTRMKASKRKIVYGEILLTVANL